MDQKFYEQDPVTVARALVGKILVCGEKRLRISETEVYWGEEDTACHAHKGRTQRTEVMYAQGGTIYVYLCYGMHWMLNIVTGREGDPQAVLIRACMEAPGPGRLTKAFGITGQLNGCHILKQEQLKIEDDGFKCQIEADKRVGIGYASQEDQDRLWRFKMKI